MSKPKLHIALLGNNDIVSDAISLSECTKEAIYCIECKEANEVTVYQLVPVRKISILEPSIKITDL